LGQETTKFGAATRAALIKFQKSQKISPAIGYFGPATREKINNR
jgi:peptidoglycan hydrolase-like protein with peptidoglycan-binding domain